MERLAPAGDVYQAGTLSGNPLATAAGLSVLRRLTPEVYGELERRGARLEQGLRDAAPGWCVQRVGAMATLFAHPGPVRNLDDARASSSERYGELFRGLLGRGIYVAPSQFEALFLSLSHGMTRSIRRSRLSPRSWPERPSSLSVAIERIGATVVKASQEGSGEEREN